MGAGGQIHQRQRFQSRSRLTKFYLNEYGVDRLLKLMEPDVQCNRNKLAVLQWI